MKNLFLISSLFLVTIFFFQCNKGNIQDENPAAIEDVVKNDNIEAIFKEVDPSTRLKSGTCAPPTGSCNAGTNNGDVTFVVQDSQFGCDITVTLYVQACIGNGGQLEYFNISNLRWSLDYSTSGCMALYNYALGLYYGPNGPEALAAYVEQLENEITHSFELALMNVFAGQIGPSAYYCGQQTPINVISEYFKSTCYRYCFHFTGTEGHPGPFVTKLRCGLGCCKRSTERCLNSITHEWQETVTFEQIGDGCDNSPDPWPGCSGFATPCIWGACAE